MYVFILFLAQIYIFFSGVYPASLRGLPYSLGVYMHKPTGCCINKKDANICLKTVVDRAAKLDECREKKYI